MPGGRQRVLDDGKQREVCALVSAGCSLLAAARYVDCVPNTIRREATRNAEFGVRFREARLAAQLNPLRAMRKAAANHWRAAAWMLERTDPDQFVRRPPPAFRAKQAQALMSDVLAILNTEIENPFVLERVRKQIRHLMQYSIDGVVRVQRTNRQLRRVLRTIDQIEREGELDADSSSDDSFACRSTRNGESPSGAGKHDPTNDQPPADDDRPATPADLTQMLHVFREGLQPTNGKVPPDETMPPETELPENMPSEIEADSSPNKANASR